MKPINDPQVVATEYTDDQSLRIRIETHRRYTVGEDLEQSIADVLQLEGDESLLDVGTGPGDFPGRLKRASHRGRIVGIDLSAGMVEKARAHHPEAEFLQANAVALPFESATFEVATARHMLYHVPEVGKALEECRRVLKPGGRFLAVTNADGYMREFWSAVAEAVRDDPDFADLLEEITHPKFFHDHLLSLVERTFGNARLRIVQSHLVFPAPEPVLDYWDSMCGLRDASPSAWARGREALARVLPSRLEPGPWQVSKRVALIVARAAFDLIQPVRG
jgi:SAM-dependent methyltransferase